MNDDIQDVGHDVQRMDVREGGPSHTYGDVRPRQYQFPTEYSQISHYHGVQYPHATSNVLHPQHQNQQPQYFVPRPGNQEKIYRGPKPTIPPFIHDDPREFSRLKIALDNLLPSDATERFKYQILVDHLKLEDALLIADSYSNSVSPYSDTMAALTAQYGQPHQLTLKRIAELMDGANVRDNDTASFRRFALKVRALVGMLDQLGQNGRIELTCGSHVTRLTSKLPHVLRTNFRRYALSQHIQVPTLYDFSDWLEFEVQVQESEIVMSGSRERPFRQRERQENQSHPKSSTVLLSTGPRTTAATPPQTCSISTESSPASQKSKLYCPYCNNNQHLLNQCTNFSNLTKDQREVWIRSNRKCWKCGRNHQAAQCKLKARCSTCNGRHLEALHDVNARPVKEERS
ncbi:uncharacterized protein LOC106512669, partial [Austrofundulus limnaeus]|uniref:Uncharacterized protein LOC106512669 n=1 Tax=Austrofundulus limnaeus TaxID=52670 RepID=A0A2I4AMG0_AUSLI